MNDLNFETMQQLQKQLQLKYLDKWGGVYPEKGRDMLLWMMIEAGEAADIIKKKGDTAIMEDSELRARFVEELCDTLMYFNDVMLCYGITPDELAEVYLKKQERNLSRW